MEWLDKAIVVSIGQFKESDIWLRLLTERHGIVSVFAFGGTRSRRRFPGCLDVLNMLNVHVDGGRLGRFLTLKEATLIKGPQRLRMDTERLGVAMNCLRFLDVVDVPPNESFKAFSLVKALLDVLECVEYMPEALPLWFRLRVASEQGYAPDFDVCAQCGESLSEAFSGAWWNVVDGDVRCAHCGASLVNNGENDTSKHLNSRQYQHRNDDDARRFSVKTMGANALSSVNAISSGYTFLEADMVAALVAIQNEVPSMWRVDGLLDYERQELTRLVDGFIEYHLCLRWEKGRFIRL